MPRLFKTIILIDIVMVIAPTRWLGPNVEFWIAAPLAATTGVLWLYERVFREDV